MYIIMAKSIKKEQWDILINFMEENRQVAKGQFNGPAGRAHHKKMWENLASQFNDQGFRYKDVGKWQKTWTDFKYNLKKKAAAIKKDQTETGGGPPQSNRFNSYEERALGILGKTFFEGVNVEELGLPSNTNRDYSEAAENTPNTMCIDEDGTDHPSSSSTLHNKENEHNYSTITNTTPHIRRLKNERELCQESVDMLKDIKNILQSTLMDINNTLVQITETLKPKQ